MLLLVFFVSFVFVRTIAFFVPLVFGSVTDFGLLVLFGPLAFGFMVFEPLEDFGPFVFVPLGCVWILVFFFNAPNTLWCCPEWGYGKL